MKFPRQCAILVGGLGTRLGRITADTPKPLLDCAGRPFLAWVIRELCRFGIEKVVLLAGHKARQIDDFVTAMPTWLPKKMDVMVSVETKPAGTGGAVLEARELLDEVFLLLNGDSWLDSNLAEFFGSVRPDSLGHVSLRRMEDASRYGVVDLQNGRITAFRERSAHSDRGLINGGMYILKKRVLDFMANPCSLERDVLPVLAAKGLLSGHEMAGYFVDIGIPTDYARAQSELPAVLRRPAVFFDRDGVLNLDHGWIGARERVDWIPGAIDAVRLVNKAGRHAFVVTNQAGVARGFYDEADVVLLHRWMDKKVRSMGANIDDWRYCPHHPEAKVVEYRKMCPMRKPKPGMLSDLMKRWETIGPGSFLVGDKESDLQAACGAGIPGHLFAGGNLEAFVASIISTE